VRFDSVDQHTVAVASAVLARPQLVEID